MMILDMATSAWLIDFCLKATVCYDLRTCFRNFMADIKNQGWYTLVVPSLSTEFIKNSHRNLPV